MGGSNLSLYKTEEIYWHGYSTAPLDRIIIVRRIVSPNVVLRTLLIGLASLGLLLAAIFLGINIKYSEHRYVYLLLAAS